MPCLRLLARLIRPLPAWLWVLAMLIQQLVQVRTMVLAQVQVWNIGTVQLGLPM